MLGGGRGKPECDHVFVCDGRWVGGRAGGRVGLILNFVKHFVLQSLYEKRLINKV